LMVLHSETDRPSRDFVARGLRQLGACRHGKDPGELITECGRLPNLAWAVPLFRAEIRPVQHIGNWNICRPGPPARNEKVRSMNYVFGAPGSGKTVLAELLRSNDHGAIVIDWDDLLEPASMLNGRSIRDERVKPRASNLSMATGI
ncbi:MAG: hypothetical protein ABL893_18785, partial [Hyphomicrobium sp.]